MLGHFPAHHEQHKVTQNRFRNRGCVHKLEREKHPNSSPCPVWGSWFFLSRKLKVSSLVCAKNYLNPNYFLFNLLSGCRRLKSTFCFDSESSQIKEFSISFSEILVRPLRVVQFSNKLEAQQLPIQFGENCSTSNAL